MHSRSRFTPQRLSVLVNSGESMLILSFVVRSRCSTYCFQRGVVAHYIVSSTESMLLAQVRALFKVMHHSLYVDDDANGNDSLKINFLKKICCKKNLPSSKQQICNQNLMRPAL
jgi:hypothetical protein